METLGTTTWLRVWEQFLCGMVCNCLLFLFQYANRHRLYNKEVIELNEVLLLILILPPVEDMCTSPGQSDLFHALPGYTAIPVQTFEMSNTNTYQLDIMRSYARVSSLLELESFISLQATREALSSAESKAAKEQQTKIFELQQQVDLCWRNARWVVDTIQTARERQVNCGVHVGHLFSPAFVYKPPNIASPSVHKLRNDAAPARNGVSLKTSCTVKVYGTEEIGICNNEYVEILINKDTTAKDVILCAAQRLIKSSKTSSHDLFELNSENFKFIALIVLSGSKERCLRDDLKLFTVQNPWEKGQLFLRLKKEAYRAARLSKSTSV